MELLVNQISDETGLINQNNYIAKIEIASALKKIHVLGPITFEACSFPQEIQNFIRVLRAITFGGCSSSQKIQNFVGILRPKTFRGCSTS